MGFMGTHLSPWNKQHLFRIRKPEWKHRAMLFTAFHEVTAQAFVCTEDGQSDRAQTNNVTTRFLKWGLQRSGWLR